MEWEVEGKFRRDETYAYLWLIHLDLGQKPTQHCKEILLQFKNKFLKNSKKKTPVCILSPLSLKLASTNDIEAYLLFSNMVK